MDIRTLQQWPKVGPGASLTFMAGTRCTDMFEVVTSLGMLLSNLKGVKRKDYLYTYISL